MHNVVDPDFHREFAISPVKQDFRHFLDEQAASMKRQLNAMVDSLTWQWKNEVILASRETKGEFIAGEIAESWREFKGKLGLRGNTRKTRFHVVFRFREKYSSNDRASSNGSKVT